jgi:hypothetical protein
MSLPELQISSDTQPPLFLMGTGYIYPGVSRRGLKLTNPINTDVKNECGYSFTSFPPPPYAFMTYTEGILARKVKL